MNTIHQYGIITRIKKFFLPTAYDKVQKKLFDERLKFYRQFISNGDLCFDIGANYGSRTDVFIKLGARAVALEPQQKCYDYLIKKYGKKAIILKKGAGIKNEVLSFFINDQNSQVSTFSSQWIEDLKNTRFAGNEWNRTEKIEVITLDHLIDTYGMPKFIKIDVEGFEPQVLKGLSKPFIFLSFEYAVPEKMENLSLCLDILQERFNALQVNYAIGEDAKMQLPKWVSIDEMKKYITKEYFNKTFAGDIYIKHN
jgi:FkbM family methyltransferase